MDPRHSLVILLGGGHSVVALQQVNGTIGAVEARTIIVPVIAARTPWQFIREAGDQIEQAMGDDDIVVEREVPGHDDHAVADPCINKDFLHYLSLHWMSDGFGQWCS